MPLLTIPRGELNAPILLFGLPIGRLIFWTAILALLHRLASSGIWLLGFAAGMAGFGPGHPHAGENARTLWRVQAALDFPVILCFRSDLIHSRYIPGREPRELWGSGIWESGLLGPSPSVPQLFWSLVVGLACGCILTAALTHRERRRHAIAALPRDDAHGY